MASSTRIRQVKEFTAPVDIVHLEQALKSGLASLTTHVTVAKIGVLLYVFPGTEEEVLAKIQVIPLPKEGKKGVNRIALVNSVAITIEKMVTHNYWRKNKPGYEPHYNDVYLRSLISKEKVTKAILSAGSSNYNEVRDLLDEMWEGKRNEWGNLLEVNHDAIKATMKIVCRKDVDASIISDAYDLFSVGNVMAT